MLEIINEKNSPINIYNKCHQQNKKLLDNLAKGSNMYRLIIGNRILQQTIHCNTKAEGVLDNKDISEILDNDY